MTKKEVAALVREIRDEAALIKRIVDNDLDVPWEIEESLNVIDGDSELLRRHLVTKELI